jgi:hypothetical protein
MPAFPHRLIPARGATWPWVATLLLLSGCPSSPSPGHSYIPPGTCTPQCDGRECGPNQCGGSCGSCPEAAPVCTAAGKCQTDATCVPQCDGAKCDDGCGGTCEGQKCWDGTPCTVNAVCAAGQCKQIGANPCDDGDPCTADGCAPIVGCTHAPAKGGSCNDGDPCTTGDACADGKCKGIFKLECKDGDPCTTDSCVPGKGCSFSPAADFTACGAGGQCVAGTCCVCSAGKSCNAKGLCVAPNSCVGKCGDYTEGGTCQCDDQCGQYGDCCPDLAQVCGACTPGAAVQCCSNDLCAYDSCGKQESKLACAFGCGSDANGAASCKSDPCGGIPVDGECLSGVTYAYCAVAAGSGLKPELKFGECTASEYCDDSAGFAWCVPANDSCQPGVLTCAPGNANLARECQDDGTWQDVACEGCIVSGLGSMVGCPGTVPLKPLTATVTYDHILPYQGYTGFALDAPVARVPVYAVVVSVRYGSDFSTSTFLDATVVGSDGSFTVKAPANPTAYDYFVLLAVGYDEKTNKASLAVMSPEVSPGMQPVESDNFLSGSPHSWAASTLAVKASGKWHISSDEGSAALQVYNAARYDFYNGWLNQWGYAGRTLAVWVKGDIDFDCGACFAPWATEGGPLLGAEAQSQVWISSSSGHPMSDAVTHHEMGHWAMASYGTSPGEGGTHYIGVKVPPGMGWSEGWATFYSSAARGDDVYFSPGGNGMFWLSLDTAEYGSGGYLWPFEANDLLQFVDENRVAALLWQSAAHGGEPFKESANQALWSAFASDQMNDGIYTRGCKRYSWEGLSPSGDYSGLQKTSTPVPCTADFLDALLCASPGLAAKVQSAKGALPYSVNNPICK